MEIRDNTNPNPRDEYLDSVLRQLVVEFASQISFVGLIDEKAKTMYSQKASSSFLLSPSRENVLGVQLSLSFSVLKQIENLLGVLSHVVLTYDKHEIVLCEILSGSIIFVICNNGFSAKIVRKLAELAM